MGIIVLKMKKDNIILEVRMVVNINNISTYLTSLVIYKKSVRYVNRDPVMCHLHILKDPA